MKSDFNPFTLEGKRILVTGASSGLGYAIALDAARMGAEIIGVGRDAPRLEKLLQEVQSISSFAHKVIIADLLLQESIEYLVSQLSHPIDGVVHSAGISRFTSVMYCLLLYSIICFKCFLQK